MNLTPKELKYNNHPEMQKFFRDKMKVIIDGDAYICEFCDRYITHDEDHIHECCNKEPLNDIRIPDVYSRDSERPERGLVGMLGDSLQDIKNEIRFWSVEYCRVRFCGNTLRLALLKAIAYQIGVEV